MENVKEQHSFNPQDHADIPIASQVCESQRGDENEQVNINIKNNRNIEAEGLASRSIREQQVGQKRKYTKRMHTNKINEGDTKSVSINDKEKNMGRWTREEKQKFIDAIRWHGKDWKKVEQNIKTRSGAQIRSHAQKFFQNKLKSEGIDIDTYIHQLQNDEANKDVESSYDDDNKKEQTQSIKEQNYLSYEQTAKEIKQISQISKNQNKFVSIVDIDGPANKLKLHDSLRILEVLKSQDLKAFQEIQKHKENHVTQQQMKKSEKEMLAQQGDAIQKIQFLSSSTPSEISSYVQQQKLIKLAQTTKDHNLLGKHQFANQNLNFPFSEDKNLNKQNINMLSQLSQMQMSNQLQNIFSNSMDQKQKIQKLSPSKLNTPYENLQRINTARWNDNIQHQEDKQIQFDLNRQLNNLASQKSPNLNSKIKILSDEESPVKINIFDDTILEAVNLDLSKIGIEFQDLWDLKLNINSNKSEDCQIYQDNPYLYVKQVNQDQTSNSQQQIVQMPKILRQLKKELENFTQKNDKIFKSDKQYKIDSIKICWHMNKNELFVYDFQEKAIKHQSKDPISILNIFEKGKANQKARIRNIQSKLIVKDLQLINGTYIIIQGQNTQKISFEVPKVTARISDQIGRRVSIIVFHQKIEGMKFNHFNYEQKQSFSALSLKERDNNINGKTPIFGGNALIKQSIQKFLNKNIEKKQNTEYNQGNNDNSSEQNLNSRLGANKKSPSQLNLDSQDGNYRLSKQVRERANSGLTIQSNIQKINALSIIKPNFNQHSSNQKNQDFINQIKKFIKNKKNQSLETDQRNNISQFFNQNNLLKSTQQRMSSANRSNELQIESKSQQESSNSIVLQKHNQYGNNILKSIIQDQNKQSLNKQNNDLLNLFQPIIQQKKNQNNMFLQNILLKNQQLKDNNYIIQKNQLVQQIKDEEYNKKQQNFINVFKSNFLKDSKLDNSQLSQADKKLENQNMEQSIDNKSQVVQFGKQNNAFNVLKGICEQQQMDINEIKKGNTNQLISNRKVSETSKQSERSKNQSSHSPHTNWNYGLMSLQQQRTQKISGESEIIDKIKASIETPTGPQSQIDSFIGLIRQQNQSIMEDAFNYKPSRFINDQFQNQQNQIMGDETINQLKTQNNQEKQSEQIQEFCTSLKSVQNVLNIPTEKFKNDQLSYSSINSSLESKLLAQKQQFEKIINQNFKMFESKLDNQTLQIINEQKQNLLKDLIINENQNSQILQSQNKIEQKRNQIISDTKVIELTNDIDTQLQQNEQMLNSLIQKKQFIYYNFISSLKNCLQKEDANQEDHVNNIYIHMKNYLGLLSGIQDQLLKLYEQEIQIHQILKQKQSSNIIQTTKNLINKQVIKEMIEIINFQILVNMNCHLLKQINQQLPNQTFLNIDQIYPYNIDQFLKIIPYSYTQLLRSSQILSQPFIQQQCQQNQFDEQNQENIFQNGNKQEIKNEIVNPESFLLEGSPIFNCNSASEQIKNEEMNDINNISSNNIILDNMQPQNQDMMNFNQTADSMLQLQQVPIYQKDSFNFAETNSNLQNQ